MSWNPLTWTPVDHFAFILMLTGLFVGLFEEYVGLRLRQIKRKLEPYYEPVLAGAARGRDVICDALESIGRRRRGGGPGK